MMDFYIVLIYIASVVYSYFGIRLMLKAEGWDADGFILVVLFIPIMNFVWASMSFLVYFPNINKGLLNKFFRL